MTTTPGFLEYLCDQLADLGPVRARRMFGGAGLYLGDVMFGLVADDVLYLKADEKTKHTFEEEGLEPFTYEGKSKPIKMSYWCAPDRLFDDPEEMLAWSRVALDVAKTAKAKKSKKRPASKRKKST